MMMPPRASIACSALKCRARSSVDSTATIRSPSMATPPDASTRREPSIVTTCPLVTMSETVRVPSPAQPESTSAASKPMRIRIAQS